jgi:hypothetical protein
LEKILPQEIGTPLIGLPTSADDQTDKWKVDKHN